MLILEILFYIYLIINILLTIALLYKQISDRAYTWFETSFSVVISLVFGTLIMFATEAYLIYKARKKA